MALQKFVVLRYYSSVAFEKWNNLHLFAVVIAFWANVSVQLAERVSIFWPQFGVLVGGGYFSSFREFQSGCE